MGLAEAFQDLHSRARKILPRLTLTLSGSARSACVGKEIEQEHAFNRRVQKGTAIDFVHSRSTHCLDYSGPLDLAVRLADFAPLIF